MKCFVFALVSLALLAAFASSVGAQQVRIQRLPYYPPRRPPPRPIRVRRAVLGGELASNPHGGADARLDLAHGIGTPDHNVIGKVFAAGNTDPLSKVPVTSGGALSYNNNGLGASISKTHTPGVRDTFTQSVNANLFNNGAHSVDLNAFKSQNTNANGFKFDRNGAGLEWSHMNGHGASLTHSNIPKIGSQLELGGKANLWSSPDRNTRLDLTGSGSQWTSGMFNGKRDYNVGLGLNHMFG